MTDDRVFKSGETVRFNFPLCACTGGGIAQREGKIVGIINNGLWFQIDQPNGIVIVKKQNIIEILAQ